jgi:hypothetical protein
MSCISGDWKRLVVTARRTSDESVFPSDDPLSYRISGNEMIIGRNEVCDAYLHLIGAVIGNGAHGEYVAFGLDGGKRRGYFVLNRQP